MTLDCGVVVVVVFYVKVCFVFQSHKGFDTDANKESRVFQFGVLHM